MGRRGRAADRPTGSRRAGRSRSVPVGAGGFRSLFRSAPATAAPDPERE
ncbi:hypothetical protein Y09_2679 [Brachybacterium sp. SW0106-09]|nr:hypothetical protein Y09_2679 [Brachybacterium sp. SW0106-09]